MCDHPAINSAPARVSYDTVPRQIESDSTIISIRHTRQRRCNLSARFQLIHGKMRAEIRWTSGVLLHNTLGKGGASPARCIPPEQGAFRAPVHPTTRNPARFLRPLPTLRGLDARQRLCPVAPRRQERAPPPNDPSPDLAPVGCAATACPVASTWGLAPKPRARLSRPTPRSRSAAPALRHDRHNRRAQGQGSVAPVIHLPDQSQPEPPPRHDQGSQAAAPEDERAAFWPASGCRSTQRPGLPPRCTPTFRAAVLAAADEAGHEPGRLHARTAWRASEPPRAAASAAPIPNGG